MEIQGAGVISAKSNLLISAKNRQNTELKQTAKEASVALAP